MAIGLGRAAVLATAILAQTPEQAVASTSSAEAQWNEALGAMASGDPRTAIPILEALVARNPRHVEYRFELALALFRAGIRDRAALHLEYLRGAPLTPGQQAAVGHLTREVESDSDWSGYLSFSIEPQTNTSGQTQDDQLLLGGFAFSLDDSALGESGTLFRLKMGGAYRPALGTDWRGDFGIDLETVRGPHTRLYQDHATFSLGLSPQLTGGRKLSFGTRLAWHSYGSGDVNRSESVYVNYGWRPNAAGRINLGWSARQTDFDDSLRPDLKEVTATASYSHAVGGNARIDASVSRTNYHSDDALDAGRRYGASLSATYAFDGGFVGGLTLSGQDDRRDGIVRLFGVERHEQKHTVELRLHHAQFNVFGFAPQLKLGYERNSSSIPLSDYENRYATLSLTREF